MFARAKGKQQKYVRQLQSVRNSVLIISPIFFSNCRVQFCDNFLGIAAYIFKRSCSSISSLLSSCNMRVVFNSLTFSISSNPLRSVVRVDVQKVSHTKTSPHRELDA